ncbi:GH92 family glycosyl hydrolase [uncultured Proteiniphilum sp.]|uniref:GH92 family glycosyl hydrolase n=1 Tax=uncultured Proteiniphilum sp. TaxID=497637 RepID=UPI002639DF92|nr:GH92 family glycosyl hydrolase [uncultured Proteiniphilum sp.]
MNKYYPVILLLLVWTHFSCTNNNKSEDDYASHVNPFIGASTSVDAAGAYHGLGKTFPGAATPFGMVQCSPNTITGGDNGSGYSYEHTTIEGFAMTQLSGIGWYGDLGNFLIMPTTGELKTVAGTEANPDDGYRSRYSKESEIASAGYYSVLLDDYKIKVEATAATHSGVYRFTFPENPQSRVQIDLARRVGGTSTRQFIKMVDDHTIEGWMECPPEGGGWGNGDGKSDYTVYFYAQFSKPLEDYGFWNAEIPDGMSRKREVVTSDAYRELVSNANIENGVTGIKGKHLGFFTNFASQENEEVILKVGISFVDIEGARQNLEKEIPDWDFDRVHQEAYDAWNSALQKIKVKGGDDDEKKIFYTALYHTMIDPRTFEDVNGNYIGGDGEIRQSDNFTKRTVFSGWDVFRTQFPLQTLINPTLVNDMVQSLVTLAEESGKGYFERWELLNAYSGCMIGNPAISVLVDAFFKGIDDYDIEKAYQIALNTSERSGNEKLGFTVRSDALDSGSAGYAVGDFSISNTLELSYTEWCMSQLAEKLGKQEDYGKYLALSKSYKNVFDPEVGWFRAKNEDGTWKEWPARGRLRDGYGTVESNPYQQGWFVPHDVEGMVALMGGREKVLADLLEFFENVPEDMMWNDYYNHANEPVHHVPFLFNRLGYPWLTQKWSREICRRAYNNSVNGLVGNDDVGQMSAWYVLASIGLYQVCPGDLRYEITSPVFEEITIQLDDDYASGNSFTIKTIHNSKENIYIQSVKLNGEQLQRCYLNHEEITSGGILEIEMGPEPNRNWGI